jgi:hypothetical protein
MFSDNNTATATVSSNNNNNKEWEELHVYGQSAVVMWTVTTLPLLALRTYSGIQFNSFRSFSVWPLLPTHNRRRGLLLYLITLTGTTHSREDSSGRGIGPKQIPLPDNTQHSRQTPMPPAGFEPVIPASERPQIHALDWTATGTGRIWILNAKLLRCNVSTTLNVLRTLNDWDEMCLRH